MTERERELWRALLALLNAANPDRVRKGLGPGRMRMLDDAWRRGADVLEKYGEENR